MYLTTFFTLDLCRFRMALLKDDSRSLADASVGLETCNWLFSHRMGRYCKYAVKHHYIVFVIRKKLWKQNYCILFVLFRNYPNGFN